MRTTTRTNGVTPECRPSLVRIRVTFLWLLFWFRNSVVIGRQQQQQPGRRMVPQQQQQREHGHALKKSWVPPTAFHRRGGAGDAPLSGLPPAGGATTTTTTTLPAATTSSIQRIARAGHKAGTKAHSDEETLYVVKRNGMRQALNRTKLFYRLQSLMTLEQQHGSNSNSSAAAAPLDHRYVNVTALTDRILQGVYPNVTAGEVDILAAETAASMSTQHIDYARLAARIRLSALHKTTPDTFSEAMDRLYANGTKSGFLDPHLHALIQKHRDQLNAAIRHERDFGLTYFGFKTLERAYLLRDVVDDSDEDGGGGGHNNNNNNLDAIVERPQYLMMRVALGIHCCNRANQTLSAEQEQANLEAALETYEYLSRGLMTHASPTLFHAGTTHPQLSSCFLVPMSGDSIAGIYTTLKDCAEISKAAGGIGLAVHRIRARGTRIAGTRGVSNGLVPMLRVYDVTSRYVDQGGGKRPGAFAVYLEPWHADILDVLNLKKNHGKEEQRARDLFYGLWIPDLFLQRVQDDGPWSLFCPHECPGLPDCYGAEFDKLYQRYEQQPGKARRVVRARDLWHAILEAQMESGNPYMLYKDACNRKSNHQHLGTIQCSNLCTEIVQYTEPNAEVAVCNLASVCLPRFVHVVVHDDDNNRSAAAASSSSQFGSISPDSGIAYLDHAALHQTVKIATRNLNKIIDINHYPVPASRTSNWRHRPMGLGVSGLADLFLRLGLPFTSARAKEVNAALFETIYHAALEASAELAEEQGPYESFEGSPTSQGLLQFQLWGLQDADTPSHLCFNETHHMQSRSLQRYPEHVIQNGGYDWEGLRQRIQRTGLRNSLLVAPMPTASTSQILGVNECFEPFSSNLYLRRVKAGEFIMANPHLLQDLTDRGLWTPAVRNQLMRDGGSIQGIDEIPQDLKDLYRTVWELKMKDIIDMAADRGPFCDQSQSLNLFVADPTYEKLTAMHLYAWKRGLKTGMYYLRTKPAANAIAYTVEKTTTTTTSSSTTSISSSRATDLIPSADDRDDICINCQG